MLLGYCSLMLVVLHPFHTMLHKLHINFKTGKADGFNFVRLSLWEISFQKLQQPTSDFLEQVTSATSIRNLIKKVEPNPQSSFYFFCEANRLNSCS